MFVEDVFAEALSIAPTMMEFYIASLWTIEQLNAIIPAHRYEN
jgi:hypothetical protein